MNEIWTIFSTLQRWGGGWWKMRVNHEVKVRGQRNFRSFSTMFATIPVLFLLLFFEESLPIWHKVLSGYWTQQEVECLGFIEAISHVMRLFLMLWSYFLCFAWFFSMSQILQNKKLQLSSSIMSSSASIAVMFNLFCRILELPAKNNVFYIHAVYYSSH